MRFYVSQDLPHLPPLLLHHGNRQKSNRMWTYGPMSANLRANGYKTYGDEDVPAMIAKLECFVRFADTLLFCVFSGNRPNRYTVWEFVSSSGAFGYRARHSACSCRVPTGAVVVELGRRTPAAAVANTGVRWAVGARAAAAAVGTPARASNPRGIAARVLAQGNPRRRNGQTSAQVLGDSSASYCRL